VPARRLRFGIKVRGAYARMREAWLEADRLGFPESVCAGAGCNGSTDQGSRRRTTGR